MKKFIKSVFAVLVCVAVSAPVFTAAADEYSFSDIASYEWAAPYIEAMYKKGYISGYEDGTYKPENDVTRRECISLFARVMGASNPANAPVMNMAEQIYGAQLSSYDLGWGESAAAYMLYKGALNWDDINTYLGGNAKDEPMKRYEAAIIITKAMNGEAAALSDLGAVLDYTDSAEIPAEAFQYVAYVGQQGVMRGMDDGTFSPQTAVTRGQIAIMLTNTVNLTEYTFERAKITGIDTTRMMMSTVNDEDITNVYSYEEAIARSGGQKIQINLLPSNSEAIFTLTNGKLMSVDVISSVSTAETVVGVYQERIVSEDRTYIQVLVTGETEPKTFVCGNAAAAVAEGITAGEVVTLELASDGIVSKITIGRYSAPSREIEIKNATVTAFNGATMTIAHSNPEYNGKSFTVRADAAVTKNSIISTLSDIGTGDIVSLNISDGIITSIDAISSSSPVESGSGIIKQIVVSEFPSITINIGGQDRTFGFIASPAFTRNSQPASIYDFRLGESVKITFNEQSISNMELIAEAAPTAAPEIQPTSEPAQNTDNQNTNPPTDNSNQPQNGTSGDENNQLIEGTVSGVNPTGLMVLQTTEGKEARIWCRADLTEYTSLSGAEKQFSDITVGQTLTVTGEASGDTYTASLVIIHD